MANINPNQPFYDPSVTAIQPNFPFGNEMLINQPGQIEPRKLRRKPQSSFSSRIPSLHLPAILLLAFSWIIHAIATFIPYWSIYSGINGSRAGLWSARNFNYITIQNFYFPETTDFANLTNSIRFTSANTKGYLVTVQFLMTFNFVVMFIVLILLLVDYISARRSGDNPRSFLICNYNTSDTVIKYALLLYIIYVFGVFEFAAWITYVGSRSDTNWQLHVSFAFAVIISVFLIIIFMMYVIEFIKRFEKNRSRWDYWYGPYIEWGFFVYLSALLLLLIVICCPEWAYEKNDASLIFAEIGLFKQCYFSEIYKKTTPSGICTLSNTRNNKPWVNATQAFMLIAYIINMLILVIIVVFRKEFQHNQTGYNSDRVSQPTFTFIIAGLILFFGFIFTLIGISIFGGEVFKVTATVNWAYIIAVFAMVLFLITGILFILDAIHSRNQSNIKKSAVTNFLFPAPLNQRVSAMQPLLRPEPTVPPMLLSQPMPPSNFQNQPMPPFNFQDQPMPPFNFQQQPMPPFYFQDQPMYPPPNFGDAPSFLPEQIMITPINYGMEQYSPAPYTQAILRNYAREMQNNPQSSYNQGLMNYSGNDPLTFPNNENDIYSNSRLNDVVRQHFVQQQRLNYNHERLLERYSRLVTPRTSNFRVFGSSSLPGRNYDNYLDVMNDDNLNANSLVAWSRAGIGSSDDTYRWIGGDSGSYEPLPRDVSSVMQHSRNEPRPFVYAENFEPVKIYHHPIFGPTPAYLRPIYRKRKHLKKTNDERKNKIQLNNFNHKKNISATNDDKNDVFDNAPLGFMSYKKWKTKHEHLIPVNPLLYKIYTQRSRGSLQRYGQTLFVPSGRHHRHRQLSHYEEISTLPPSDADSILSDIPQETSSSLHHRYHKLHSHQTSTTVPRQPLLHLSEENNGVSSDKELNRPDPPIPHLSRNKSNLIIRPLLSSSVPSPSDTIPLISTATLVLDALPIQNTSVINNADKSGRSSLNVPDTLKIPSVSLKPESISASGSTDRYQTVSSVYNNPPTITPFSSSTSASSDRRAAASSGNALSLSSISDLIPSVSDSNDDDNEKRKRRQKKKKSTAAIDIDEDVDSSSSND